MADSSMQSHLLRLQEIMANSASKPAQPPQHATPPKQVPVPQQKTPSVDISVMTEWKPALKHVTRLFAANPQLEGAIRKMILEHQAHEEQWWKERTKASTVAELKTYDAKVYKAQMGMKEYMSRQLHAFGIPFFGPGQDGSTVLELQQKMLEHLEDVYGPD